MKIETETAIVPFDFNGAQIRVIRDDKGEPWFVAKDVAMALGIQWKGSDSISHVPAQWKGVRSVRTPGGNQEMVVLSKSGLYFFLNRSDSPLALPFQMWVNGEVLPAVEKTGGYILGEEHMNEDEMILAAMQMQQRKVELLRKQLAEKDQVIEAQAPKVERYDAFLDAENGITVDKAAKAMSKKLGIDVGQKRLFKFLRLYKFLRQNNSPYQQYIERGLFTTCLVKIRSGAVVAQTLITPKGFDRIVTDFMDFVENGPKAKYVI